jgi:hypothetical protein
VAADVPYASFLLRALYPTSKAGRAAALSSVSHLPLDRTSRPAAALLDMLATACHASRLTVRADQLQPLLEELQRQESQQQQEEEEQVAGGDEAAAAPSARTVHWPRLVTLRVQGLAGAQQMADLEALLDALPALHYVQQLELDDDQGGWGWGACRGAYRGSRTAATAAAAGGRREAGAAGAAGSAVSKPGGARRLSSCTTVIAFKVSSGPPRGIRQPGVVFSHIAPLLAPQKGLLDLSLALTCSSSNSRRSSSSSSSSSSRRYALCLPTSPASPNCG